MTVAHVGAFALASLVVVAVCHRMRVVGAAGGLALIGVGIGRAVSARKD